MTTDHTTPDRENPAQKWKFGDEYLPFHPQASHVNPDYRDGWNRAYWAAHTAKAAPEGVNDEVAKAWAWQQVREQVGTANWTTAESFNFHQFFCWGWSYRGQYVKQFGAPASPQPLAPPPGYAVVPLEPTPEMQHAGARRKYAWENGGGAGTGHAYAYFDESIKRDERGEHCAQGMYRAMLAAAPQPPASVQPLAVGVEPEPDRWCNAAMSPEIEGRMSAWLTNGATLHPLTINLVVRFARAMAAKLAAAEVKYGYSDGWKSPDWMDECRAHLLEHIAKGDPRDVAAYCMFLWHHGESTAPQPPGGMVPLTDWQPIETAPDDETVVVFYLMKEGDQEEEFYTLDFKEDGGWVHHNDHYEHYCAVAKGGDVSWVGPSEKAPYTHWKRLGTPAGITSSGIASSSGEGESVMSTPPNTQGGTE